jgi:hypothetical protein
MRPPLHRRAPKTARRAALHRMSDLDSENQAPSLDHRVGAAILHALTAIGYPLRRHRPPGGHALTRCLLPWMPNNRAIDILNIDRRPIASMGSLALGLGCSWCQGSVPMPRIVGFTRYRGVTGPACGAGSQGDPIE